MAKQFIYTESNLRGMRRDHAIRRPGGRLSNVYVRRWFPGAF